MRDAWQTGLRSLRWVIPLSACWTWIGAANALDVSGVWATDAAKCSKIFAKTAKGIVFSKDADIHGGGFIIDGNTVRGRVARCRIKTRKEDGAKVHMLASCSNDIMLSDVQLSVKVIDPNRLARIFPEMENMEMNYERCDMK